jgi:hypothetical protein
MAGVQNEDGVSVIVGTLLLILITVIAAAGLAIMVSQMQKDEMNRQSHLAAVKSEKIEILNVGFANDRAAWNQTPLNIPTDQAWDNWSSITFTLVNLNTEDSKVIGVAVNDRYIRNYSTIEDTPAALRYPHNLSAGEYLSLKGTRSQKIQINFTNDTPGIQYIRNGDQIQVRVMTSLYNMFEKTIRPPNPVFQTNIETEDLGAIQRRVIVLDGSASTADTMVADWNWTIYSGADTKPDPGNWSDTSNMGISYSQGKIARVTPLNSGPFRIRLKVTDDAGMFRISNPVDIPADQNYVPISNVHSVRFNNSTCDFVIVTVKDINGKPVQGVTVNFAKGSDPYHNLVFGPYYNVTDADGNTNTMVKAGNGTIKVIYGKFPEDEVPVGL